MDQTFGIREGRIVVANSLIVVANSLIYYLTKFEPADRDVVIDRRKFSMSIN